MSESAIYTPSAWGEIFHALPHDEALGAGSAGPGKSLVLLHDSDAQIYMEMDRVMNKEHPYPLVKGASTGATLHLRRTRPMLEETIIRAHQAFPVMDEGVRWDSQKTTFYFTSGYRYQFGHCKDPDDWQQYLSMQFSRIVYDELIQFDEEQYDQINTRLRSSDPVLRRMLGIRAMSNPMMRRLKGEDFSVKNPQWVRDKFVSKHPNGSVTYKKKFKTPRGEEFFRTWIYLRATLYDNPDKEFVANYERNLASARPHIRQALLYGNWFTTAGSFYGDEWNESLHVVRPFEVPAEWAWFRSMDWGFKNPGCIHWWALDYDNTLYCIRELTFQGKYDEDVAKMARLVEEDLGCWDGKRSLISGPADTQIWEQRGNRAKSIAQVFAENGMNWVQADKKGHSRARNAGLVAGRLGTHGNGTIAPGLVFFDHCKKAIETIPSIQKAPYPHDEEPMDGGADHWHDSVCYAVAYASRGRLGVAKRMKKRNSWEADDENSPREDRGTYGYGE
jgi:hypothetical protein